MNCADETNQQKGNYKQYIFHLTFSNSEPFNTHTHIYTLPIDDDEIDDTVL